MPDIALCRDWQCPSNSNCYRYTAEPSSLWQTFTDFRHVASKGYCDKYWPLEVAEAGDDIL